MSNREIFAQALKCFADPQRRDEYFHFYSPDIIVHGYQGIEPGLDRVKQFYYGFWRVFPDAQVIAQDLIGEGDTLVAQLQAPCTRALWVSERPDSGSNSRGSAFCISETVDASNAGPARTR
jgi:predicted ester cyclase